MNAESIIIGAPYQVEASGTSSRERWVPTDISKNARGDWEVTAKGTKTAHLRTFTPEQFVELDKRIAKKIISVPIKKIGDVLGTEMWLEDVKWWPPQERRGRKPKVAS